MLTKSVKYEYFNTFIIGMENYQQNTGVTVNWKQNVTIIHVHIWNMFRYSFRSTHFSGQQWKKIFLKSSVQQIRCIYSNFVRYFSSRRSVSEQLFVKANGRAYIWKTNPLLYTITRTHKSYFICSVVTATEKAKQTT